MVQPAVGRNFHIVDLATDDENEEDTDDDIDSFDTQSAGEHADGEFDDDFDFNQFLHDPYPHTEIAPREVIDLTAISDIDVPPSDFTPPAVEDAAPTDDIDEAQLISEAICLQLVVDVFPDVSIDHVLTLIRAGTTDQTRTKLHSEQIVNELLEGTYPKEADVVSKKRRREESDDASDYEKDEREPGMLNYHKEA